MPLSDIFEVKCNLHVASLNVISEWCNGATYGTTL